MTEPLKVLDLFSGIGGFSLGLERTGGFKTIAFCEIDNYCQRVLKKHWPEVYIHSDIRTLTAKHFDGYQRPDVICGGFPCQDVSLAGFGAGLDGERSGLWVEYLRLIREMGPRYVLVENVAALLVRGFGRVVGDLAESGYSCEWDCLPAGYFGAPHLRERVFLLAYPDKEHGEAGLGIEQDRPRTIFAGRDCESFPVWLQTASRFAGMDDGIPARAYSNRVGALGNSIVPQIAQWIGERILEANHD